MQLSWNRSILIGLLVLISTSLGFAQLSSELPVLCSAARPFLGVTLMTGLILAVILYLTSLFVKGKNQENLKMAAIIIFLLAILGIILYLVVPPILQSLGINPPPTKFDANGCPV